MNGEKTKLELSLDDLKTLVQNNEIVAFLPHGAKVIYKDIGEIIIEETLVYNNMKEAYKEIVDIIDAFNGKPTKSQITLDLYTKYQENPSAKLKQQLKEAYESIPGHLRVYVLGDMDAKDWPIRKIIYDDK